jgi:long-chain fatty acid transport protein
VQIQYAKVDLVTGLPVNGFGQTGLSALGNQVDIYGNGWGYGFTAGITLTPNPATTIGLGYRSQIDQKIDGTMGLPAGPAFTPGFGSTPGSVSTTVNLPDIVSLGIRQRLDAQWTLLGTVEWSNWSRIGTATVEQPNGAPATIGTVPVTLPFQYDDGWYFALGAEYVWTERTTLRAGIAYEISPITDQVRTPRLPDNDRVWLSAGMSYKIWKGLTGNIAYTHIFVRDTAIDISSTSGNPWFNSHVPIAYVGSTKPHVDIIALGLSWQWGEMAAPAKAPMYKK